MLNWLVRYQPAIDLVHEERPATVLDVGSGWHGLSWYWEGHVVQTDVSFEAEARPAEADRRGTTCFIGASVDALPFVDDSFDVVICLDMFEHLDPDIRRLAVAELARVGKTVVIAFPNGVRAKSIDASTFAIFRLLGIGQPLWLKEHRAIAQYPDTQSIADSLPAYAGIAQTQGNANRWFHLVMTTAEHLHRTASLPKRWETRALVHGLPGFLHRGKTYRAVMIIRRRSPAAVTGQ